MSHLQDLETAISELPQEHQHTLVPHLIALQQKHSQRTAVLNLVQEAISQLRLDMKYIMFDLEATRRERDAFKNQLEK